jgi:hypothetical protein
MAGMTANIIMDCSLQTNKNILRMPLGALFCHGIFLSGMIAFVVVGFSGG